MKGDEISVHARIFAIADCYDALISDRPYRPGMPLGKVVEIIREGSGKQFDPKVVQVFEELIRQRKMQLSNEEVEVEAAELA